MAFDGFSNAEKTNLFERLKDKFDIVNDVSNVFGISNLGKEPLIVISKYGAAASEIGKPNKEVLKAVVSQQWAYESLERDTLVSDYDKYGFSMTSHVFFIFDAFNPESNPT